MYINAIIYNNVIFFSYHGTCTCFIRSDISYKRGHRGSDFKQIAVYLEKTLLRFSVLIGITIFSHFVGEK